MQLIGSGMQDYEEYKAFKQLCMIPGKLICVQIRNYYIEVEELFKRYVMELNELLITKNIMLENDLNPYNDIPDDQNGVVHVFKALNTLTYSGGTKKVGYKIGSTDNEKGRLPQYNTGNLHKINILYKVEVDNANKVENCVKNFLGNKNRYIKKNEVYTLPLKVIKKVINSCAKTDKEYMQVLRESGLEYDTKEQIYLLYADNDETRIQNIFSKHSFTHSP